MRVAAAWIVGLLLLTSPTWAQAPRDKWKATQASLQQSEREEAELKVKLTTAAKDLLRLRERATTVAANLQASERRVAQQEQRYAAAAQKLAGKEQEFSRRSAEYADTLSGLLRMKQLPPTALLAKPQDTQTMLRTASAMQHVSAALHERANALQKELAELHKLKDAANASKTKLVAEKATLASAQASLNRDLAARQTAQKKLSYDLASAQARVGKLSRESRSLQELIGKLEVDRRAIAIARPVTAVSGPITARGDWKLPVIGEIIHRFGQRKNANETYRGLVMRSSGNASVVSPAAGEVVFTGPFRDYGKMVLIKHRNDHISLLAGLDTIAVTLNQAVGRGEPLGSLTARSTPELYLELRDSNAKPIDPAGWFANVGARLAKR